MRYLSRMTAAIVATAPAAYATSDAATRFGAREAVGGMSLSPDGTHVAYLQPAGARGTAVVVVSLLDGSITPILTSTGNPDRLRQCHWSTNTRLVCGIYIIQPTYGLKLGYRRLIAVDLDGKNLQQFVAVAPVTDPPTFKEDHRQWADFHLVESFVGVGEHLKSGSPAQNAAKITAPVLLFHGDQDQNVSISESRLMASRLRGADKKVELVAYKGLDHYLEDGQVRAQMLDRIDGFLRASLAM